MARRLAVLPLATARLGITLVAMLGLDPGSGRTRWSWATRWSRGWRWRTGRWRSRFFFVTHRAAPHGPCHRDRFSLRRPPVHAWVQGVGVPSLAPPVRLTPPRRKVLPVSPCRRSCVTHRPSSTASRCPFGMERHRWGPKSEAGANLHPISCRHYRRRQ